jgi:hypothetical protein
LDTVEEKHRVMARGGMCVERRPQEGHTAGIQTKQRCTGEWPFFAVVSPRLGALEDDDGVKIVAVYCVTVSRTSMVALFSCRRRISYFLGNRHSTGASLRIWGECAKDLGKRKTFCGAGRFAGWGQYPFVGQAAVAYFVVFPKLLLFWKMYQGCLLLRREIDGEFLMAT